MLNFYKEQRKEVEEKLKQLIRERADAGIGNVGQYNNQIERYKEELQRLNEEIEKEESKGLVKTVSDATKQLSSLNEFKNLAASGAESLEDAKLMYTLKQRIIEEIFEKPDKEIAQHYPEIVFYKIFSEDKLSDNEIGEIRNLVHNTSISWQRKIMVVGALTISLINKFDAARTSILIDFVNRFEDNVWQRAFTGLVLSLNGVAFGPLKIYHPELYRQITYLQHNDNIQLVYEAIFEVLQSKQIEMFNTEGKEIVDEISGYLDIFNLEGVQKNELSSMMNYVLKTLEESKLSFGEMLFTTLGKTDFYKGDNKMHHWFLGFDENNLYIKEAIWNSKRNIGKNHLSALKQVNFSNILQHLIILNLNENVPQAQIDLILSLLTNVSQENEIAKDNLPVFSFIFDIILFEKYYPNDLREKISKQNWDIFNSSLTDILLHENSKKRLLSQREYKKASNFYNSGQYEEAIACYKEVVRINPDNFDAFNDLGSAHSKLNQYEKAIEQYLQAIQINPEYYRAFNNMGIAYRKLKQNKEAIECYEKALKIQPDYYSALYNMGVSYTDLKKYQRAIECHKKAIFVKPYTWIDLYYIGDAYRNLAKYAEAIEYYEKAVQVNSNNHDIYNNMGISYGELGEHEKEITCYEKAIEIKSDYHYALGNMGFAHYRLAEYNEAIRYYKKALKIKPDYCVALINMADAYYELDKPQKAIECYKKALEIKPDDTTINLRLGLLHLMIGNIIPALEKLNKSVELGSKDVGNIGLGYANLIKKDKVEALKYYKLGLEFFNDKEAFFKFMEHFFQHLEQHGITRAQYDDILEQLKADK